MASLPAICICTAAARDDINLVWEAMGRGPNNISRKLCAIDPNATWETPATHYMMQDMSATDSDVAEWQALCNGDLPLIQGTWGEDGIISAWDAQVACSDGNLQVFSAAGLDDSGVNGATPTEWRDGVFIGVGLMFVPDAPI